jgi:hypothetical protein
VAAYGYVQPATTPGDCAALWSSSYDGQYQLPLRLALYSISMVLRTIDPRQAAAAMPEQPEVRQASGLPTIYVLQEKYLAS